MQKFVTVKKYHFLSPLQLFLGFDTGLSVGIQGQQIRKNSKACMQTYQWRCSSEGLSQKVFPQRSGNYESGEPSLSDPSAQHSPKKKQVLSLYAILREWRPVGLYQDQRRH